MRKFLKLVALLLVAPAMLAADPPREAWEWTDTERFEARMDSARAAERARDAQSLSVTAGGYAAQPYDVIMGNRDAHLFLPFELFNHLVKMALAEDPTTRSTYRAAKETHRVQLGLPVDMWLQLETITAPLKDSQVRERNYAISTEHRSAADPMPRALALDVCRDRYAALTQARDRFGPAFVRFLYAAVAPDLTQFVFSKPDVAALKAANRGCR